MRAGMVPPTGDARFAAALLLFAALSSACKPAPSPSTEPVRVAAAADLTLAFEELGKVFEANSGQKVSLTFGASGALAKQLGQGGPFDVFAAANASFVDDAVKAGACDGSTKALYARGYLVAWNKAGGPKLHALSDLRNEAVKRISIANPDHAPYGKAAREALMKAGIWSAVESKIVPAENVRQALQFAETGNTDVAIVALSLIPPDNDAGQKLPIDPALYAPIDQTLVVCRHGKNAEGGRAFAALVESTEGQKLLQRYGFGGSAEQAGK
jgi:molybdate transport system substrate-binding protein